MNELSISSINRIANQFETVFNFIQSAPAMRNIHKPASGKWSIQENLAHLARYQEVFIDRIEAILKGDNPAFVSYVVTDDVEFPLWTNMSMEDLFIKFKDSRRKIFNLLISLSDEQVARKGRHPRFGEMKVAGWVEFFLLHEAHHLLTMYALYCESRINSEQEKQNN